MLDEIEAEFGPEVARIVAECSDTFEQPKPPWRARKEAYIAHLPEASPSALRVSVADKLANARAILLDYRRLGEDLWARFDPAADQLSVLVVLPRG
jgi:(p)ppGpp synthase/HD superfamily hydrolase